MVPSHLEEVRAADGAAAVTEEERARQWWASRDSGTVERDDPVAPREVADGPGHEA